MRRVKKWVYYCDFCGKRALRSLADHEEVCTANPDRKCRLCAEEGNPPIRPIIEKYKGYFQLNKFRDKYGAPTVEVVFSKEFTLDDIRKELDVSCPNCLLAIIRALGLSRYYFEGKFKFDYQGELKSWWDENGEREYPG